MQDGWDEDDDIIDDDIVVNDDDILEEENNDDLLEDSKNTTDPSALAAQTSNLSTNTTKKDDDNDSHHSHHKKDTREGQQQQQQQQNWYQQQQSLLYPSKQQINNNNSYDVELEYSDSEAVGTSYYNTTYSTTTTATTVQSGVAVAAGTSTLTGSIIPDGWDDDDEVDVGEILEEDNVDNHQQHHPGAVVVVVEPYKVGPRGVPPPAPSTSSIIQAADNSTTTNTNMNLQILTTKKPVMMTEEDGDLDWNVHDWSIREEEEEDDNNNNRQQPHHQQQHQYSAAVETAAAAPSSTTTCNTNKAWTRLHDDIHNYLMSLQHMGSSMNAVLESEYNGPDKAIELIQYYMDRPQLREYTIQKELPRMDYTLLVPSVTTTKPTTTTTTMKPTMAITDKSQIIPYLLEPNQQENLVIRCANQSILADFVQVFTGPDLLIRSQYMTMAVARSCQFTMELINHHVQVEAKFDLTLPTEHYGPWKVAEIHVHVDFWCHPHNAYIDYTVISIQPCYATNPSLSSTTMANHHHDQTQWINGMIHEVVQIVNSMDASQSTSPDRIRLGHEYSEDSINYRDIFLKDTQSFLIQNSNAAIQGIQSAWSDWENVMGPTTKKIIKIPTFLPDDVIQAALQDEEEEHVRQQQLLQQQKPSKNIFGLARSSSPVPVHQQQHQQLVPPLQQQLLPQQQKSSRPPSILGGLVSGWTKLAQSVALPTEDVSLYDEYAAASSRKEKNATLLTSQSTTGSSSLELYRRDPKPTAPDTQRPHTQGLSNSFPSAPITSKIAAPTTQSSIPPVSSSLSWTTLPPSGSQLPTSPSWSPTSLNSMEKDSGKITFGEIVRSTKNNNNDDNNISILNPLPVTPNARFSNELRVDPTVANPNFAAAQEIDCNAHGISLERHEISATSHGYNDCLVETLQQDMNTEENEYHIEVSDKGVDKSQAIPQIKYLQPVSDRTSETTNRVANNVQGESMLSPTEMGTGTMNSSSTDSYIKQVDIEEWLATNYNPIDDIIPTRRRWTNPRPGPRRLGVPVRAQQHV